MFRVSTNTSTSLQNERGTYLAEHFHPRISALVAAADVQELQPQVIRHGAEGGISDQEALLQDKLLKSATAEAELLNERIRYRRCEARQIQFFQATAMRQEHENPLTR